MNYRIIIKPQAEEDIEKATLWYEEQRAGLGEEFLVCLDLKIKSIESNPKLFEVKYNGIRQANLKRFPYNIHYLLAEKIIYIIAVLHSSMNPEHLVRRRNQD